MSDPHPWVRIPPFPPIFILTAILPLKHPQTIQVMADVSYLFIVRRGSEILRFSVI